MEQGKNLNQKIKRLQKASRRTAGLSNAPPGQSEVNLEELTHDLEVQKIELETQNKELKQVRESLQESRDKYQDLYNSAPVGYLTIDQQNLIFEANNTIATILGINRNRIIGTYFTHYIAPESQDTFYLQSKKAFATDTGQSYDLQLRKKDGSLVPVQLKAMPVKDNQGVVNQFRIAVFDVTDSKRTEESFQISEGRFRNLVESTSDFIWEVNRRGEYTYASPQIFNTLGYKPEEILGKKPFDLMPPEENKRLTKVYRELAAQEKPFSSLENINLHKDGHPVVVETSGTPFFNKQGKLAGYRGIDREITERKRIEKELAKSRDELETKIKERTAELMVASAELALRAKVLDSAYDAILLNSTNGNIWYANEAAIRLFGYTREELCQNKIDSLIPMGERTKFEDRKKAFLKTGETVAETQYQRKDGSLVPVEIHSRLVKIGEEKHVITVVRDITERKKIEAALRESEAINEDIIQNSPYPVIAINPDDSIRYVNPALEKLTGFTRDKLIGLKAPYPWWPLDKSKQYNNDNIIGKNLEVSDIERLYCKKNGEEFWIALSMRKVVNGDRIKYYLASWVDITERKKMEEALRESETFNSNILKNSPHPILAADMDSSIRYVNPALEKLTGFSQAELIGVKVPYPWWPPDKHELYLALRPNQRGLDSLNEERCFQKKTGELFWVILNISTVKSEGQKKYRMSNWVDITERKQTEEKIKQNELRHKTILEALTEGVALIAPDGTILEANKAEAKILGLSSQKEFTGTHFGRPKILGHILPDGSPFPIEEAAVTQALKNKRSIRNFESGIIKKDGSVIWINANAVPIIDESGEVTGVVRSFTDITEEKKLRDEKQQFTQKLIDAQEEERKRISRDLHDDTAQYLALLKLEMDAVIEKETDLPPGVLSRLERLRGTAEKALQEVRRFAHEMRPSVIEHFGLPAALEQIISEFKEVCDTQISFNTTGDERRLPDHIELSLFRIVQEAMNNIRKHSEATKANIHLKFGPQKVQLTIADNGIGFVVSRTPQKIGKGSLGLVGMRERAHLIGADLKIRSQPDHGTVVSVEIKV